MSAGDISTVKVVHLTVQKAQPIPKPLIFITNMISSESASGTWETSSVCCWEWAHPLPSPPLCKVSLLAGWSVQQVVSGLHETTETSLRTDLFVKVLSELHRKGRGHRSLGTCAIFAAGSYGFPRLYRFEVHPQHLVHLSKCTQPQGKLRKI